ncbi:MAG: type IV pilus assembly protein PilM [Candidatus Omnitrophota bacterium]
MKTFDLFKKKSSRRVGLDIGSDNLKVVEIEIADKASNIINMGIKNIQGLDPAGIPKAIKDLLREANISTKEVNISIAGENVVARYLSLPKMAPDELRKAMEFQIEDHIPFKADEVYTDYKIIGDDPKSKNRMQVFLVAAKKELIEAKSKLIQEAGLKAQVITMDALAIKNTLYFNYSGPSSENNANIAILNIGNKTTNIIITKNKTPYFVRDVRFGGETIGFLLKTKLNIDQAKAEELKRDMHDVSAEVKQMVKLSLTNLLNEIFASFDFYENLTEQRINQVYLAGGFSQFSELKEFLGGYLNLEPIFINPFQKFNLNSKLSSQAAQAGPVLFSVAAGLALEEL